MTVHHSRRLCCVKQAGAVKTGRVIVSSIRASTAPAGFRFPREVIAVAVRWYLRYGLSYRDVEELLVERGIVVDHVTVYRWVQRFTADFVDAARPARHCPGDRRFVDETYVKIAGLWHYLYRAVDQHGQVIDVLVCARRNAAPARTFFARALHHGHTPVQITTDQAPVYPRLLDDLAPTARHATERTWPRPRLAQSQTSSDTRPPANTVPADDRYGARVRAEPAPRTLRARRRAPRHRSGARRLRRNRAQYLRRRPDNQRRRHARHRTTQQSPAALARWVQAGADP
jgi:transposase-like protein